MEKRGYEIALGLLNGIGPKRAKSLVSYIGSVEGVFKEKAGAMSKIPGIGSILANNLNRKASLLRAEQELKFIEKNKIQLYFYKDENYPRQLTNCDDSPIMLYGLGNLDFNKRKKIAVVGTRKASAYGRQMTKNLVHDLIDFDVQIISGLAYGIDISAHKAALEFKQPTIGVLAHGLDRVYPQAHQSIARQMLKNGGLITEFLSETTPDKENFPKRNRIVAGMCDAVVVVESSQKGGSLITAGLANDYNRDVFSFPGNADRSSSVGCNYLIQKNRAHLITCAQDLIEIMGWQDQKITAPVQTNLFTKLSLEEDTIVKILQEKGTINIDDLSHFSQFMTSKLSVQLFNLEMKGVIRSLPGKMYEFV